MNKINEYLDMKINREFYKGNFYREFVKIGIHNDNKVKYFFYIIKEG